MLTRLLLPLLLAMGLAAQSPAPQTPRKKRLLCIGAVKGFQHDATSHGLATLWKIGQESGLWDTYIRTDTQLLTKKKLGGNAKTLDYFDAIVFYTTGELDMDAQQKADLLSFVRDDGKGFIAVHSGIDTFYEWPEYGDMTGGYFDLHPWNQFNAPVIVEDPSNPIVAHFPKEFSIMDEIYQVKNFSRDKVRVLMSLDASKIDLNNKNVRRTDKDFAVSWLRNYGKGRVFYSTLGHREDAWNRPDVQKMYLEAVKWAMGMSQADATPRPKQ
ncbi:MAG: ThuA domain-containing protein [Bryobacterales bacterium]|nr:ThuA domain-containing protein [Bryobacterales bacterium]